MKEQILKHIQTASDLAVSNLPLGFISTFGEEKCSRASAWIIGQDIGDMVGEISKEAKTYFIDDPEIAAPLKEMTADGTKLPVSRLEKMFHQAKTEKLSAFDGRDIKDVLLDEEIPITVQFHYLKYYKHVDQTEEEHVQVLKSLEKYVSSVSLDMSELTGQERSLLADPLFTRALLDNLLDEKETWELLVKPGVMPLLREIGEYAYRFQYLDKNTFLEIAQNPQEIQERLERVLEYFQEDQYPDFLEKWIENGVLLTDLRRLEKMLPDMTEDRKKEILNSRVAYVCTLYRTNLDHIDMTQISKWQEEVLLYAIPLGKKHFLKLVNENSGDFLALGFHSLILDPDIYRNYLNLNTLNEKNLRESFGETKFRRGYKEFLNRKSYTFEELHLLASVDATYCQLYGFLSNERSDVRLRIFREIVKNVHLPYKMETEKIQSLAMRLSEKPLSVWMREELGHIRDLKPDVSTQLLTDWEEYQRFVPGIQNERQAIYLIRNQAALSRYKTLEDFQESLLRDDEAWLWLREKLSITDEFVEEYEENIRQFVYNGEAEIVYAFCIGEGSKREEVRRLLCAELMGKFAELKYHEADLEKEIDYPVSPETEHLWKENLVRNMGDFHLWEEDRFIPMLQIGEIPMHTCISYKSGINKSCLLSCFDANKKVLYLKIGETTVFRALIRLTKGSVTARTIQEQKIEFADLTKEKNETEMGKEELVLFLERPYFSRISEDKENEVVSWVYQMVQEKAKKLHARLVISQSYTKYEASGQYEMKNYYVYISASKNGNQYLDSLGGEATVSRSGLYGKNSFLMEKEKEEKAA